MQIASQQIKLFSSSLCSTPHESSAQMTSSFEGSLQKLSHFFPLHCGISAPSQLCETSLSLAQAEGMNMEPDFQQSMDYYSRSVSFPLPPGEFPLPPGEFPPPGSERAAAWHSAECAQFGLPCEPCSRQKRLVDSWGVYMHFSSLYKHERLCLDHREGRAACLLPEMCHYIPVGEELEAVS